MLTKEERAERHRVAVKKNAKKVDRLNVTFPKGTVEKIRSFGLEPAAFVRENALTALNQLEKIKKR